MDAGGQDAPRVLLLHPPYADYTCPYHSLSYVAAPLRAQGYAVDVFDINAIWFRQVFTAQKVATWSQTLTARLAEWDQMDDLSVDQQIQLTSDIRALAACRSLEPQRAVDILRGAQFYDPASYRWAQDQVRTFEKLLDKFYAPYGFSQAFAIAPHEPNSKRLLDKAAGCHDMIADFVAILRQLVGDRHYVFCGITAPYSVNLVPAMALFDAVRQVFPGLPRVGGGTAIVDVYKYRKNDSTLTNFSGYCDYFYIGEAENGIGQLANFLRDGSGAPPRQAIDLREPKIENSKHVYVALANREAAHGRFTPYDWTANPPAYDWIDWSLYLSPVKRINYAPIRGCFWNKCTFCDYGLNEDGPTAPFRSVEVEVAMKHLGELAAAGIQHVYLAADAVSPSFLRKFADALLESGLTLSWSCQLFLTKTLTTEFIDKLERAGMVLASFGLESGSATVLERMGKGADRVEQVLHPALQSFRSSRIGLQPLYFYGFPGETSADRQATVTLLQSYSDLFSPVSRGGLFGLMAGSMIAREPAKYGLRDLTHGEDEDIIGELKFQSDNAGDISCTREAEVYNRQVATSERFERPWAGGVDTLHSHLYVERFGRDIFQDLLAHDTAQPPQRIELSSHFDLEEVSESATIASSLRTFGNKLDIPQDVVSLTSEVLVPVHRAATSRRFVLEFSPVAEGRDE